MEADRTQPPYFPYPDREWGQSWQTARIPVWPTDTPGILQGTFPAEIAEKVKGGVIGGFSISPEMTAYDEAPYIIAQSDIDWTDFMRRWTENIRVRADYMDGASDI